MSKKRKIPQRKCLIKKELMPKDELIRIVKTKNNEVFLDPTGKKNGRGAYLSKQIEVINQAETEDILSQTFKMKVDRQIYQDLRDHVNESE